MTTESSLVAYLERVVHPALFENPDTAFPEFAWRRTTNGWVATNRGFTKERFGVRPDRVICRRPFGFLIHGERALTWCAYVHGGTPPHGRAFRDVVAALATRAGVALPSDATPERGREQRAEVLARFLRAARRRLLDGGDPIAHRARAELVGRAIGQETWSSFELGLTPTIEDVQIDDGHLHSLGLTHDHWIDRIVGAWRDARGELVAIFGRRLHGSGPKYLCCKGRRPALFGLPLAEPTPALVLVEGLFDALALRAAGVSNVLAAGGSGISQEAWLLVAALGCRDLTLWFDSDVAGQLALLQASEGATRALQGGPQLFVIHPDETRRLVNARCGQKVDPNSVVTACGRRGVLELLARRCPARVYAALHGAEEDLDQALLGSLGAVDWDLQSILKEFTDLSEDAQEIARSSRNADALLEGCLEAGRALRRAGVPAARVAAELAPRLAQLASETRP